MKTNICFRPATSFLVCLFNRRIFTSLHLFIFSHDNVDDFCFCLQLPEIHFGLNVVVANNTTNGSPYFCGRTSTERLSSAHRLWKAGLRHAWMLVRCRHAKSSLLLLSLKTILTFAACLLACFAVWPHRYRQHVGHSTVCGSSNTKSTPSIRTHSFHKAS